MDRHIGRALPVCAIVAALRTSPAAGQCRTVNFDDLPPGTPVTTQYPGVRFSARHPDGSPAADPIIFDPAGGTTTEPNCLSAPGEGEKGTSPEFLRIDFNVDQQAITFKLGVREGCDAADTVEIRAYDANEIEVYTTHVPVNGTVAEQVLVFVRLAPAPGFRRVEIEADGDGGCPDRFELIDDLFYESDDTPPVAQIISPAPMGCACHGDMVRGFGYDPDGELLRWRLDWKSPESLTWTFLRSGFDEVIDGDFFTWTLPEPQGYYLLRLIVNNLCNATAEHTTATWIDREFDDFELQAPLEGAVVGGRVCAEGTVSDHCDGSFTLERRAIEDEEFSLFDEVSEPWVVDGLLGSWDSRAGFADGDYEIRVTAVDECGNTPSILRGVTLDNTPPTALISAPTDCGCVNGAVEIVGTVSDEHLGGWELRYTGGDENEWVTIASGSGSVTGGLLGIWDTTGLAPCAYILSLMATDRAVVDCDSSNRSEFLLSLDVGPCDDGEVSFDVDRDGDVDLDDYAAFQALFTGPSIP